jgi:hypothetical protein
VHLCRPDQTLTHHTPFKYRRCNCDVKIKHSPITLANLVSIFRCSSPPRNPLCSRRVDPSVFVFSLSSHRHSFSSQIKSKVGNILTKVGTLRITLNIDDTPITSKSHSPIVLYNLSSVNLVSIFTCSSTPHNPVYERRVDPSSLVFSL